MWQRHFLSIHCSAGKPFDELWSSDHVIVYFLPSSHFLTTSTVFCLCCYIYNNINNWLFDDAIKLLNKRPTTISNSRFNVLSIIVGLKSHYRNDFGLGWSLHQLFFFFFIVAGLHKLSHKLYLYTYMKIAD